MLLLKTILFIFKCLQSPSRSAACDQDEDEPVQSEQMIHVLTVLQFDSVRGNL